MTGFADRAEQIAAHLVSRETGAVAHLHDTGGRQAAVDFQLEWPDGRLGALEVTLVTDPVSIAWQGMAAQDGWRWEAETSWEYRPTNASFHYKSTRRAVIRAVQLCDQWYVAAPEDLPDDALAAEPELTAFLANGTGTLRRTPHGRGVALYPNTRAEFVDAVPSDFSLIVESWHNQPHIASHIEKVKVAPHVSERHLFLVPLDEVLPARFFTDDFDAPERTPQGFEGVDAVWVWSNHWRRCLVFRDGTWRWLQFPPR